jgi:hypothetical protein
MMKQREGSPIVRRGLAGFIHEEQREASLSVTKRREMAPMSRKLTGSVHAKAEPRVLIRDEAEKRVSGRERKIDRFIS